MSITPSVDSLERLLRAEIQDTPRRRDSDKGKARPELRAAGDGDGG